MKFLSIALLTIAVSLPLHAQPMIIPLNFEWEYDFGDYIEDRIILYELCDPDSDDIPDFFCINGHPYEDTSDIYRLSDNQEIWQVEDFPYRAEALKVMDADRDGTPTLWLSCSVNDSVQKIYELDIETGDIIDQNLEVECRKILSFGSLLFDEDTAACPIAGEAGFKWSPWPWWWGDAGNILKLDRNSLSVIDSAFDEDCSSQFISLDNITEPFSGEEFLVYGRDQTINSDWPMNSHYYITKGYIGVVDNDFNSYAEQQLYSGVLVDDVGTMGTLGGIKVTNYVYCGSICAATLHRLSTVFLDTFYCWVYTACFTLPDLELVWEDSTDDYWDAGDKIAALDMNGDSIDELVILDDDHFDVLSVVDGDTMAVSENYSSSSNADRAIISDPDGFALYIIDEECLFKYSGEHLEVAQSSGKGLPVSIVLKPAYPNPFNPSTAISYKLQADSYVELTVYDVIGREVAKLVDGYRAAGSYEVTFDGSELASGVYFARLTAGEEAQSQKILLLK